MTEPNDTLGDRIRARRDARREAANLDEIKAHIDKHFEALHARLDKLEAEK